MNDLFPYIMNASLKTSISPCCEAHQVGKNVFGNEIQWVRNAQRLNSMTPIECQKETNTRAKDFFLV
jgi:hypothetical protein